MASALDTARAAIESQVSSVWAGATAIQWMNRPFTPPTSGGWLRVTLLWGEAQPLTMTSGALNDLPGVLHLSCFAPAGEGLGTVTRLADDARNIVDELQLTGIVFGVPTGPREVRGGPPEWVHVALTAPFRVIEAT